MDDDVFDSARGSWKCSSKWWITLYRTDNADIAKAHSYVTGGFIGGVTMTDQASGFGRGFDVYDDQFTFSFEDMSRDGGEVTQHTAN